MKDEKSWRSTGRQLLHILGDVYHSLHRQDKIYRGCCCGAARVQLSGGIIQEGGGKAGHAVP